MKSLISVIIFAILLPYQSFGESYLVKYDTTIKSTFFKALLTTKASKSKSSNFCHGFLLKRPQQQNLSLTET